jgi:3-oxoacyl-(acyl-carrier-protein) synthase
MSARVVVAGSGAICAAGKSPGEIWDAVWTGRRAIRPIQQWDASGWPTSLAGEIAGLDPRALLEDRKVHRLLQRSDLLGLYVAGRALDDSGFVAYREALEPPVAAAVNDRTGVYVGLGGGGYQNEYEFFPLLTTAFVFLV